MPAGDRPGPVARVLVLAAFALLVVATQLLWLSFAAISPQTAQALGVSEGAVGDLAVVFPALFVLLAIPAGRWLDRRYAHALAAGAVLTVAGAVLRALDPTSYGMILAGQLVMSAGQPFVLNATTKIAPRYFPARQQTGAISVASAAQFVGILLAVLTGGMLLEAGGLQRLLVVHAGVAALAAVAVLVSLRVRPRTPTGDRAPADTSLRWLRNDPLMWKLAALLFVGVGSYNALATWLDSIMTAAGHPGTAGGIIAAMTVAGVIGAIVVPGLVGPRDARRAHCIITTVVLATVTLMLTIVNGVLVATVGFLVLGFFLLGTLPVLLDWSELHVGADRAGTATGLLLLAGNLGGVVVVLSVQVVIGQPVAALAVMAAWALPGLLVAWVLPRRVAGRSGSGGREVAEPVR